MPPPDQTQTSTPNVHHSADGRNKKWEHDHEAASAYQDGTMELSDAGRGGCMTVKGGLGATLEQAHGQVRAAVTMMGGSPRSTHNPKPKPNPNPNPNPNP